MKSLLVEMEFDSILNESRAQTKTGSDILDKYRSYLMINPVNYNVINSFVNEAKHCTYDNGINEALKKVADFIVCNKTKWAIASAIESINSNGSSHNYLNRNAAKQAEKLLEMSEEDVVKYIKAGALKNVMYCESLRNITKQVFKDQPIVEAEADCNVSHPVSLIESVGDGVCFQVFGNIYKIGDDKTVQEAQASDVSNVFINVSKLLNSNLVKIYENCINISLGNTQYEISEANKCTKIVGDKRQELTVENLRDNNRLVLMATSLYKKNNLAGILESIAQLCENYNNVVNLDNVSIYTTKADKFMVIESANNLFATLLQSTKHSKWTINENAIDAVSFIKSKTNVSLNENYKALIESSLEQISEDEQKTIEEQLLEEKKNSYRTRIEALTEKFKNDPVKLAILSKIAQTINE